MGQYCGHSTDCLIQIYASSNSASLDVQETSSQQELGSTALRKGAGCANSEKLEEILLQNAEGGIYHCAKKLRMLKQSTALLLCMYVRHRRDISTFFQLFDDLGHCLKT